MSDFRASVAASGAQPSEGGDSETRLAAYVPRIALNWLAESPGAAHRRVDGTLLFVDVSGFTALTEKLAARGKVGAEEITDVIGAVFGELLGVASSYGADLLKWGGDAVLLYFSEPHSAPRAVRAAVLMSRAMKRVGRFKTPGGRITLEVSIAAHSGSFDLYLLGDRHRELIVTGPEASVTARMEAIAEAGEVVASAETARRLEPGVLGGSKLEGVLVAEAPEADTIPLRSVPDVDSVDVYSLLPASGTAHLLGGSDQAEHRQATVAFIEFSGIDSVTNEGGPDAVTAALGPVIVATEQASARYGVYFHETDIGAGGGKIVLLGGVPAVRGNDAERVLRAVHDVLAGHPSTSPVGLRAGVNAGRVFVFAHDFGLAHRRVFAVTGDAVNLAARVMGRAGPGRVVATEAALIRARNPFETEDLAPFKVKGKSEPVIAAVVGRPRYSVDADVGDGLPFVGREAELANILRLAEAAASGSGGVVEIVGAPGIGKSRLVTEAIDRWTLGTLRVACEEYGSATPYLPFRRILRRLLGIGDDTPNAEAAVELRRAVRELTPDLEGFLPLLADVVDVAVPSTVQVDELETPFRRRLLENFVVRLLHSYLSLPSALVLEDAHAIDEASASLLGRIAVEAPELPLLVVLTRGPEGRKPLAEGVGSRLVLELEPLAQQAAVRLAGTAGGVVLTQALVAAIVERAGGNPLFLRELLRSAGGSGGLEGLPESLEPLLVAEIDLLSLSDRQALRAAAVLGTSFDSAVLQDLLDGGAIADENLWSRLSAFVVPTASGWRFAHGLMRDAAYEGLSFKRRKELHARAALAIETRTTTPEEAAELLSLHWLHAEGYDQAWRYARIAGDRARVLWANAEAAAFYARALEAAGRLHLPASEVSSVAEALGDACELTGSYDQSRRAYSQARRLGGGEVDRARLLRKTGVLHERLGRYPEALKCYTKGRRLLVATSRAAAAERAELDLASAGIKSRQGRYKECVLFATEAARDAGRARHRSGLAHALYLQHMMSVYLSEPSDKLAHRSLAIFEEMGDLVGQGNVLNNLGIGAYYLGRWAPALESYERSREVRVRAGDVVGAATEENNIAEILSDQGDYAEARSLFESARSTWVAAGYRVGVALATSNLGRLEARAGDVEAGRTLQDQALDQFRGIHSQAFIAETQLRIAECQLLGGDLPAAIRLSLQLLNEVRGRPGLEQTEAATLRVLGSATGLAELVDGTAGDLTTSNPFLDEAIERSTTLEARYELALSLACRSALQRLAEAGPQEGGAHSRDRVSNDGERAQEIFSHLGVRQAVITWSTPAGGGPLFARTPSVAGAKTIGDAGHDLQSEHGRLVD